MDRAGYEKLTPSLALSVCAPHTWPASIVPVLLAVSVSVANGMPISILCAIVLLAISVLLQSGVNCMNDYFDFKKGTDTEDDCLEVDDSVLVNYGINPDSVKGLAIALVIIAFALGIYVIFVSGWVPLAIAMVGAICIFLYSGGRTPISYLPIGELVSGFVMGELIAFASYVALSHGSLNWEMLALAIPAFLGIALIMLTNNSSDIEKDEIARRKTLPVVLRRDNARILYKILVVAWMASIVVLVLVYSPEGLIFVPFVFLLAYQQLKLALTASLEPHGRIQAMANICNLNITLGIGYCLCIASKGIEILL